MKGRPRAAFFVAVVFRRHYDGEPMPDRPHLLLFLLGLAMLAPLVAGAQQRGENPATLALEDCNIDGSGGYASLAARCGYLTVAENPDAPEGRSIRLFVAVIPSQSSEPPNDAFTFLAGGPGQAASTSFVDLRHAFERLRRDRDIVLVDQRGTGRSAPMDCAQDEVLIGSDAPEEQLLVALRECLSALEADPRFYTTSVAVDDLERVREALGYQQFNVYGGSYGTRVGLHYLRKYPDSVRTLVLDGVVPADLNLGPDIALMAQRALESMFSRCAGSTACSETFGDVQEDFAALSAALRAQPVSIRMPDPVSGALRDVTLDYMRFAIATRLLSYSPDSVALMPLLLHEGNRNAHLEPLAAQALMIENSLSEALSFGMHNSVVCTEDVPFYQSADIDLDRIKATYLGDSQLALLRSICEVWPAGIIDENFKAPVRSDLPVLLLSGSADPITPPAYAERAAESLANHLHLVGQDMGHILAPLGCVPRLIARYVDEASLENVAGECVERLAPLPFFTSFNGPTP